MGYRESSISTNPNLILEFPQILSETGPTALRGVLVSRAWFLHHENTQSVETGIWTLNLRIGVPAC